MAGPSKQYESFQMSAAAANQDLSRRQVEIAEGEKVKADQLYNLTYPGVKTAVEHYAKLGSGSAKELFKAIAPATERVTEQIEGAKENIKTNMPRGGERRLALEQADIAKASQIGTLGTNAYLGAFPAQAELGGKGISLSTNEIVTALHAFAGSTRSLEAGSAAVRSLQEQQAAGKAATMGFLGSLAEKGGSVSAAKVCWIAMAIFGDNDPRTHLVRHWINNVYAKTLIGSVVVALYGLFGRQVARLVRTKQAWRRIFEPVFQAALRRARREVVI